MTSDQEEEDAEYSWAPKHRFASQHSLLFATFNSFKTLPKNPHAYSGLQARAVWNSFYHS